MNEMSNDLQQENYAYFKTHLDELIEGYGGRFVVIKDARIIADYDSFDEAYNTTVENEELGTFLIQRCVRPENDTAHFAWHTVTFGRTVQA
jgi:hypothetical protein